MSTLYRTTAYLLIIAMSVGVLNGTPKQAHAAWSLEAAWNTGDINSRPTYPLAAYDRDQSGTASHYLAPIQHGVSSYDGEGNLEWSYNGITRGFDVRDIVVGDLQGNGYDDTIVVGSGFYYTATDGRIAILDEDGTELQMITESELPGTVYSLALDGTDIYVGAHSGIVEKLVKSGSTWTRDTTNWPNGPGGSYVKKIQVADLGNGKRIIFTIFGSSGDEVWVYHTDGTLDWSGNTANYANVLEVGNVDSTYAGDEVVVGNQGGVMIFSKDGDVIDTITTGNNVRVSVTLYDVDDDGEDEIYFTDMGNDLYAFDRTGVNTFTQLYSLADLTADAVLSHFDLDEDGEDEIIAGTSNGYLRIFSADLSTTKAEINIGQGVIGGFFQNNGRTPNGIIYSDINGDGHTDILVSASVGYMFAYTSDGLVASDSDPPTPDPSTFATAPDDASSTSIDMTATTATDDSTPVEYYFTYEACDTNAGTGGTDSGWQESTSYTDTGLQPNQCYGYSITARDSLGNTTATSSASEAYTAANIPNAPILSNQSSTTIDIDNDANSNPSHTTYAVQIENTSPNDATWEGKYVDSDGTPSDTAVWLTDAQIDAITITGLTTGTYYEAKVKARNGDNDETAFSTANGMTTEEDVTRPMVALSNVRLGGVRF